MNHRHVGREVFHLVRLQMADEMPLHIARHFRDLPLQFLHVALAENPLSGIVSLAQLLDGMKLTHRHEPHTIRQRRQHLF